MKSTVENLSATRVRLAIEVPFAELEPSLRKVYRELGAQVSIPGFRKGKVPKAIIDQRFGRERMIAEAVHEVIPEQLVAAIREHDVRSMGTPQIAVTEITDGQHVRFTAEVDIRPEITLPDLASLEVVVDPIEVTDADVDAQVESLRLRFASLRAVDRVAQRGDFVQIDLVATIDGKQVEGGTATNLSYEMGSGQLLAGLDDALLGMAAGAAVSFTTELVAGEHAGREADIAVTLRAVKERDLPVVDDEFAQTASEFDTLAELREDLDKRLRRVKRVEQLYAARDKALEALAAACVVPIPHHVADEEVATRRQAMVEELEHAGLTLAGYLASVGRTESQFDAELAASAAEGIKTHLLIEALAETEKIAVSDDEFGREIVHQARRAGMPPQEYYDKIAKSGMAAAVYGEVRRAKALRLLLQRVQVRDSNGAVVSVDDLTADQLVDNKEPGEGRAEAAD